METVTFESASTTFLNCGLKSGDIVEFHGSLKAIGLVSGGPNTILDALLKVLTHEGTLLMAAQYSDNTDPAHWENPPVAIETFKVIRATHPPYKGRESYLGGMGAFAQTLQLKDDTLFSQHPNMAIMASGKQARWLSSDAPLTPAFGLNSPFEKAIQLKAKVLLIGVGYDVLTGMHVAEAMSGYRPYRIDSATIEENGKPKRIKILDYEYDSDIFTQIGLAYEKEHSIQSVQMGSAVCKVIDLSSLHAFTLNYFKEHL